MAVLINNAVKQIALWDSTGSVNAPSKLFQQFQDTISSPNKSIVISLRGTNPPGADYRIREFTVGTLGDTISVVVAGVGFVTNAVKVYPGEGQTPFNGIVADSAVVTKVSGDIDANTADVRWWARGR